MSEAFPIHPFGSQNTPLRWQSGKETLVGGTPQPPRYDAGTTVHGFELQKLLGSGSSGHVYRARELATDRTVALKVLSDVGPDIAMRARLGFRRMLLIDDPHLVRAHRIYRLGEDTALAMEEVEGVTLAEAVPSWRHLPVGHRWQRLLRAFQDYAAALVTLHFHRLIHRDVQPKNLMIDVHGHGRIIDYGLVDTFAIDSRTDVGSRFIVGTPDYLAPEVISQQRYLPAGDIFSLGVVMLEALRILGLNQPGDWDVAESIIRNACNDMTQRDPSARPSATELARLGESLPEARSSIDLPTGSQAAVLRRQLNRPVGRTSQWKQIRDWLMTVYEGQTSRLHLTGEPGMGRSKLVLEVLRFIEEKKWGQAFVGRPQHRDPSPLRAFSEICDAIAARYQQNDRDKIVIDPVSLQILVEAFPVFQSVLRPDLTAEQASHASKSSHRLDALEAGARLSHKLRAVGPLFILIDDAHLADRDSLNVIDRLHRAHGAEGLGILTTSGPIPDQGRIAADVHVTLPPLDGDAARELLRGILDDDDALDDPVWDAVIRSAGGNPSRLINLAEGLRTERLDALEFARNPASAEGHVDPTRIWHERFDRLSDAARELIPFLLTAQGSTSIEELSGLSESADVDAAQCWDTCETAITELVRARFIIDSVSAQRSIEPLDTGWVAALRTRFTPHTIGNAHLAWAEMLSRRESRANHASRIAEHYFAANCPGQAISHASLAAERAVRMTAYTEAARWHERIIPHVRGRERTARLRAAADCYHEADRPVRAAKLYQRLARRCNEEESVDLLIEATRLLFSGGKIGLARRQLRSISAQLGVSQPKNSSAAKLVLVLRQLHQRLAGIIARDDPVAAPAHPPPDTPRRQTLSLCLSIARPLAIFDELYAADLNLIGVDLAMQIGSPGERLAASVGPLVIECQDHSCDRDAAQARLQSLTRIADGRGDAASIGHAYSGLAESYLLSMRFAQVAGPLRIALNAYQSQRRRFGLELAQATWMSLWADWQLGSWAAMRSKAREWFDDATRRTDWFQKAVCTSGLAAASWLIDDDIESWWRDHQPELATAPTGEHSRLASFEMLASLANRIYAGNITDARQLVASKVCQARMRPTHHVQIMRIQTRWLAALTAFGDYPGRLDAATTETIRRHAKTLHGEGTPFADVLASLIDGHLWLRRGTPPDRLPETARDAAIACFQRAAVAAAEHHLVPYQLAAEDALGFVRTGIRTDQLRAAMRQQHVAKPDRLGRLYTPPLG